MQTSIIKLNPTGIIYDMESFESAIDPQIHITKDIYDDDLSSVIIGRKKSYLLYHANVLQGYCHSLSFAMNVIRTMIADKINKDNTYEIHIKKNENTSEIKLYLYKLVKGYVYGNYYHLEEKYRISEVPKIELKYRGHLPPNTPW